MNYYFYYLISAVFLQRSSMNILHFLQTYSSFLNSDLTLICSLRGCFCGLCMDLFVRLNLSVPAFSFFLPCLSLPALPPSVNCSHGSTQVLLQPPQDGLILPPEHITCCLFKNGLRFDTAAIFGHGLINTAHVCLLKKKYIK